MRLSTSADAHADLGSAWRVLLDIATWPRWTESMTSVQPLDAGGLRVGSRARVKQPGMRPMVWQVTSLRDREEFTWENRQTGVHTVGRHVLAANPDGTTRITLEIEQTGPLAWLVGALTGARTRRYMDLEAAGLKAASEAEAGTR